MVFLDKCQIFAAICAKLRAEDKLKARSPAPPNMSDSSVLIFSKFINVLSKSVWSRIPISI